MPGFENIHKNKKFAFIDGVLSGLAIAWIIRIFSRPE